MKRQLKFVKITESNYYKKNKKVFLIDIIMFLYAIISIISIITFFILENFYNLKLNNYYIFLVLVSLYSFLSILRGYFITKKKINLFNIFFLVIIIIVIIYFTVVEYK